LVRQEVTVAEVATEHRVDRSTIMRIHGGQTRTCPRSGTRLLSVLKSRSPARTSTGRSECRVGYVPPNDEHEGRGKATRKARPAGLEQARLRRLGRHRPARQTRPTQGSDDVAYFERGRSLLTCWGRFRLYVARRDGWAAALG
jgi:hypothetical protein